MRSGIAGPGAWFRALTLLQKFSLLSLGWMVGTTIVGGAIAGRSAARSALRSEVGAYSEFLQALDREHGLAPALDEGDPAVRSARIAGALAALRGAPGVARIKVYDRRGTIVWSDEPRYNGLRFENRRLQRALQGEPAYELEVHRESEHRFEPADIGGLIELYLPLRRGAAGEILGVVEIYRDAGPLLAYLRTIRQTFWLIAAAGGLIVFLSMQVIVRGASTRLRQAERQLREYSARLEQKVQERTRQLEAANLSLMAASQHKSEFLAHMSHELRTPLNSILGFSEVLEDGMAGPLSDKQRRFVHNVRESGKHLLALINDILDLAKVEAGRIELHPEALAVEPMLEDVLTIVKGQAAKKHLTVGLEAAEDLPGLRADPIRLKQILFNLLSNAVKFTPDGGRVTVAARLVPAQPVNPATRPSGTVPDHPVAQRPDRPMARVPDPQSAGEWLKIRVTDTGIGIEPRDMPKLFREFVQLDNASVRKGEGTGLGLALTKKLVELHGGRIWAESAGEGRGSTFTVVLPVAGPAGPPDASAGAPLSGEDPRGRWEQPRNDRISG